MSRTKIALTEKAHCKQENWCIKVITYMVVQPLNRQWVPSSAQDSQPFDMM